MLNGHLCKSIYTIRGTNTYRSLIFYVLYNGIFMLILLANSLCQIPLTLLKKNPTSRAVLWNLLTRVHVLEGFQRNMYPKNMIPSTYNIDCYLCCDFRVHCSIFHYRAVIMGAMTSRITTHMIVYSTVYSGSDQRTSKLRVTGLCERNSPVTGEFPAQMVSNA